jgi:hypothetical protein
LDAALQAPHVDSGLLLLADISGYTSFLGHVAAAHPEMALPDGDVPPAYPLLSSLLDLVVARIAPTFVLADIEGDAVFAYALRDRPGVDAAELLAMVRSAYHAFRARLDEATLLQEHDCQACLVLPSLDLKFVLHHGVLVVQRIAGREKLLGPAVIVAHRLLKNSVTERTGWRGYLFVTSAAAERLGLPPGTGLAHEEVYPDVGPVNGVVIELDASTDGDLDATAPAR